MTPEEDFKFQKWWDSLRKDDGFTPYRAARLAYMASILHTEQKRNRIYKSCQKHQGLTWNFPATVAMPAVDVCPHCEQEATQP